MIRALLCILGAILSSSAVAQTIYKVPADTKGNTIVLTVANESQTMTAQGVSVQLVGNHPGLTVSSSHATVKTLQASGSSDVTFTFAVSRDVKPKSRDTLDFEIRDKTGDSWTKSIVVEYTGPHEYKLDQNFPNPFNPTTTIYYDLPVESHVSIVLYDILGREVARLVNETREAGFHAVKFSATGGSDAHNLASGGYIYRMVAQPVAGGKTYTGVKKLMVLK